jgi:hypothetical protein
MNKITDMKKLKKFRSSWLVLVLLFAVVACNDKDDSFSANGDVVFLKKKIDNQVVTAAAYYLYANQGVDSVTVTLPGNSGVVELKQYETSSYSFWNEPKAEDFMAGFPTIGEYKFNVTSQKGESFETTDEQDFYNLSFAEIDSMNFNQVNLWFYVRWNDVQGADSYVARLFKLSGEMIFNGYTINADEPEYYISTYHVTGKWEEAPVYGQRYMLKISSIKYDDDATDDNNVFNVQEVSETVQEIIWMIE